MQVDLTSLVPDMGDLETDLTPVDWAAKALVRLVERSALTPLRPGRKAFHLACPMHFNLRKLLLDRVSHRTQKSNDKPDAKIRVVSLWDWLDNKNGPGTSSKAAAHQFDTDLSQLPFAVFTPIWSSAHSKTMAERRLEALFWPARRCESQDISLSL